MPVQVSCSYITLQINTATIFKRSYIRCHLCRTGAKSFQSRIRVLCRHVHFIFIFLPKVQPPTASLLCFRFSIDILVREGHLWSDEDAQTVTEVLIESDGEKSPAGGITNDTTALLLFPLYWHCMCLLWIITLYCLIICPWWLHQVLIL